MLYISNCRDILCNLLGGLCGVEPLSEPNLTGNKDVPMPTFNMCGNTYIITHVYPEMRTLPLPPSLPFFLAYVRKNGSVFLLEHGAHVLHHLPCRVYAALAVIHRVMRCALAVVVLHHLVGILLTELRT